MHKLIGLIALLAVAALPGAALAQKSYDVCWSHYTGWEPWAYVDEKGLLDEVGRQVRHRRARSRWSTTTSSRSTSTPRASTRPAP